MGSPSQQEREALLELLLAMSGPLIWTGPIPYDALGARHTAEHRDVPLGIPAPMLPGARPAPRRRSAVPEAAVPEDSRVA